MELKRKFFLAASDYQDLAGNTGSGDASGPNYEIIDPQGTGGDDGDDS